MRRLVVLSALTCIAAAAQAAPVRLPTAVPGIVSLAGPPAGFDAVHASDADLATYGFPPRPAVTGDGQVRRSWERLMAHARFRVAPQLSPAPWRAGVPVRHAITHRGQSSTTNWSGLAVSNTLTTLGFGSFVQVVGEFNVPIAQQAFGICDNNWDYSAVWVGLDGVNDNAVLQAGTESDAYCGQANTVPAYYAWVEWFPAGSIRVTNLAVTGGDDVGVFVNATGPTTGRALVINATTNQYVSMEVDAPAGSVLQGSSVEWIMERPSLTNNKLATLTNYVSSYMSSMSAATLFSPSFAAGTPPAFTSSDLIRMTDDDGDTISTATPLGSTAMQFQDSGSAF